MPYKDPDKERACGRRRYERITAERLSRGMCPRCGEARPVADHSLCQCCGEKRRQAERARCAKARAAGILYAGRDAERCRRSASDRSKRRDRARREAGLCTRCGKQQPVEGGTVCEPCREARREREREQYAARRAAGECGRCGAPPPRQRALRTVRQERGQTLKEKGEELSSILHLIILSDGKPGHRMSF